MTEGGREAGGRHIWFTAKRRHHYLCVISCKQAEALPRQCNQLEESFLLAICLNNWNVFFFCIVWHRHARTHTHTWQAGVENTWQCVEGCMFCWLLAVQLSFVKAPKKVCYRNNKLKYITEYLLVKPTYYICMCTRLPDTQYCVAGCGHVAVQLSYFWIKLYCSKVCYSYCHFSELAWNDFPEPWNDRVCTSQALPYCILYCMTDYQLHTGHVLVDNPCNACILFNMN